MNSLKTENVKPSSNQNVVKYLRNVKDSNLSNTFLPFSYNYS